MNLGPQTPRTRPPVGVPLLEEARGCVVGPKPGARRNGQAIPFTNETSPLDEPSSSALALRSPRRDAQVVGRRRQIEPTAKAKPEHDALAEKRRRVESLGLHRNEIGLWPIDGRPALESCRDVLVGIRHVGVADALALPAAAVGGGVLAGGVL